ncbi:hypothetical protein [Dictyobacter formicarum]|uniref:Uncharacterized protein n=1 Tax=Dictyobacter formicarum TaxID=2778368 RepID=A0ABQ3VD84_9CHLR|nr:hypothetical protein [Dictyobacter formicarum]GHO83358.1 hypothetical protein KSZ_13640 [Dictyobacter formicarum]
MLEFHSAPFLFINQCMGYHQLVLSVNEAPEVPLQTNTLNSKIKSSAWHQLLLAFSGSVYVSTLIAI